MKTRVTWTALNDAELAQLKARLAEEAKKERAFEDEVRLAAGMTGDEKVGALIGTLKDAFDTLNTNKTDDVLDFAEVEAWLKASHGMTKEESTTVLAKWDTDSSKTVDFREFCFMFAGIIKVRLAMVASGAVRSELCFTSWTVTKRSPSLVHRPKRTMWWGEPRTQKRWKQRRPPLRRSQTLPAA